MENLPLIVQVAAWIYVLKQFSIVLVPIVGFGVIPGLVYGIMRLTGSSHKEAIGLVSKAVRDGIEDAL